MSDIIVKFKPVGHEKLQRAVTKLKTETDKATKSGSLFGTRNKRNAQSMGNFGNTLSTARSKLLLWNFAMGAAIKVMTGLAKQAAKLESLRKGFDNLTGSAFKSNKMMTSLKIATNGTMSEMDLMTQANAAMTLGITSSSEDMAEMFDMSQRLGRALGVDTVKSIEALIVGLGRQSVKRLDDIGIVVKSNEAYQKHAAILEKTASQLTDTEKRQAFFNAALESARKKMKNLGPEVASSQDAFDQFSVSISEMGIEIGEFVLPHISGAMDKITEFMRGFTETDLERTVRMLTAAGMSMKEMQPLVEAMAIDQTQTAIADLDEKANANLKSLMTGFAKTNLSFSDFTKLFGGNITSIMIGFKNLSSGVRTFSTASQFLARALADAGSAEFFNEGQIDLGKVNIDVLKEHLTATLNQIDNTGKLTGKQKEANEVVMEYAEFIKNLIVTTKMYQLNQEALNNITDEGNKLVGDQTKMLSITTSAINDKNSKSKNETILLKEKNDILKQNLESLKALKFEDTPEGREKLTAAQKKYNQTLIAQQNIEAKLASITEAKWKAVGSVFSQLGDLVGKDKKNAVAGARLAQIGAVIDTLAGANKAFKQGGVLGFATGASIMVAGYARVAQIEQSLAEMQSVPIGQYAEGGYVGGRPHSQGGTMIEAERGEFVMSRNAVESIGLETLSQLNEGGGGSVNVTVTGNVMTQDFVEGELAESIKEAVRRGSDFGIS